MRQVRIKTRADHGLVERARADTRRDGTKLASIVEEEPGPVMAIPNDRVSPITLPECRAGGGTYAGVNLNDMTTLLDRMGNRD
jgi:hypothetical protein